MDTAKRRRVILISLVLALVLLPLILLSPWGMSGLENLAVKHSGSNWAARLQINLGDIYGVTLRRVEQRAAYERFLGNFENRPERGYAKYMIAQCLEREQGVSRETTIAAYEDFLYEYAGDPLFQTYPDWEYYVQEAERAIDRVKAL